KGEEFFAVKIFRIETRTFWRLLPYVNGDPRFEGALKKRRALAFVLARKEFSNLKVAWEANVRCPKPIKFLRNILISTFLGENGIRYPRLAEAGSENPETDLNRILEEIKRLYSAGLVHSDISEYNVVMCSDGPYLIDFAQAVSIKHPRANEFLERDVSNIIRYFEKKYGIRRNKEAEIAKIISV
ncbi:MAG: RIO1 family regulatory kinase/ATPase, partial [Candidatus Anstonellales archaeon]